MASHDSGVDLSCPVCMDVFVSPRFLPCHHTLCTECISDLMERASDRDHFLCPLCQGKVKVPEEGVTSFQVNFYLAPLLTEQSRLSANTSTSSNPGSDQCCRHCQRRESSKTPTPPSATLPPAVAQCRQCQVALCRACIDRHLRLSASAGHSFGPLATAGGAMRTKPGGRVQGVMQNTPETSPSSSLDLSCDAHWSGVGEMAYFCKVCSTLICRPSCSQHQGQGHAVVDVSVEAQSQRSEVRRQLLSLTTLQGSLADLEDEGKHRVTALEDSCQQVAQTVETRRQQLCASIAKRATRSTDKVKNLKGRIVKVVEGELRNIQEKMGALSALLSSANEVLASSDAEFLSRKAKLMAKVQSVMSKVPPSRGNMQFSFRLSPDVYTLLGLSKNSVVAANLGSTTVQFQSPVLRHKLTLTSTKQQRKLRKLRPRKDGTMMAAVGNCLVYISAEFAETKRLEFPGEIVDFLPVGEECVYVVLPFPNAVKKLNTTTDVAGDFVSPLNPPTAVAFTDKEELVFASNDGKELSLTYYWTSGARTKRITLPKPDLTPTSMVVADRGRLYLCSSTEVLCLDSDLSDLASLNSVEGLSPRCLTSLRGTGGGIGDVLVSNWAAGNVEVIDVNEEGKFIRKEELIQWKRGTTDEDLASSKGLVHNISCAVVDSSGKLWIGQEEGHVSIYDWLLKAS